MGKEAFVFLGFLFLFGITSMPALAVYAVGYFVCVFLLHESALEAIEYAAAVALLVLAYHRLSAATGIAKEKGGL